MSMFIVSVLGFWQAIGWVFLTCGLVLYYLFMFAKFAGEDFDSKRDVLFALLPYGLVIRFIYETLRDL